MKSILRKILPGFVADLYDWYRLSKTERRERRELDRIKKNNRYQEGYTNIFGEEYKIKYVDNASFVFIYEELFKKEIYKFKCDIKDPLIIDAGANIGLSVIYFKRLFPESTVIAFEPDQKVFDTLDFNVRSFGFKKVELIKKALWNTETELNFFSEGADGGRLATKEDTNNIIKIQTTLLSNYIRDQKIHLLKIDIEGAEFNVLMECREYLKNVKNIFVEYHSFKNRKQNLGELINILEQSGFRIITHHIGVHSGNPFYKIEEYEGMDLQLNIYGIRV
jgi:FkbM family methyltransferase